MAAARFLALVAVMLLAGFFGAQKLMTVRPVQPDAPLPTFHPVDTDTQPNSYDQAHTSDDDRARDRLRNEVLDYAKALTDDPCNTVLKTHYIDAVVGYVRARTAIAPCLAIRSCSSWSSAELDRARKAFGTPLDHRVRDAMQATHAKVTFGTADFPKDTAALVADLAADESMNSAHETAQFRRVTAQLNHGSMRQDCGR